MADIERFQGRADLQCYDRSLTVERAAAYALARAGTLQSTDRKVVDAFIALASAASD